MMKFYGLILSCLTFLMLATPVHAGRLLFWRFEANQNRLIFTTDQGVQPTAELISNPTRLVINLPGTILGRPTVKETLGNVVKELRIGQPDPSTTRVVIELAPGYVIDPQGVKVKGLSPTQWYVELPTPQRSNFPTPTNPNSVPNRSSNTNNNINNNTLPATNLNNSSNSGVQVTSSGILVGIEGGNNNRISVKRSQDRRKIDFEITNLKIPETLPKSWNVNQYGVSEIQISQQKRSTLLTLNVHPDSPDWQGSFTRMGGFVLWPQGGINRVVDLPSGASTNNQSRQANLPNVRPPNATNEPLNRGKSSIESIELLNNQLLIRGNQPIQGQGSWTQGNTVYQIRLENTDLASNFRNPTLPSGSPISRMRIWQPDNKTVVLLIETALGARIDRLNQPSDRLLALSFNRLSSSNPYQENFRSNTNTSIPITQAPPDPFNQTPGGSWQSLPSQPSLPPVNNRPIPNNRPVSRGKTLVVIDPGHGGKDVGAVGVSSLQEKQIVLSISQQVARILEQQGIQVQMTRDNDYFVSLPERTAMANRINADVFVSIHANSAGTGKPEVSGYETYYFQNGRALADIIHRNVIRRVDVRDRKIKQARFYVLRTSNMPSVLLETGFVTGTEDAAKLSNPNFQRQMSEAIAAGIIEYVRTNRL